MSLRYFGSLSIISIFLAVPFVFSATITINQDVEYQTIEGWGASSNFSESFLFRIPGELREELFDLIFEDLGTNILCIRLYSDFQGREDGEYNWGVMEDQREIINAALERGNIDNIWVKVSSPPGWMKDNNDAAHAGHLLEEHYQTYADYLSYYIRHMESDYDIHIDAVSIFNEPGWEHDNVDYESTSTTPEEYRDVLKVIGRTFEEDEIDDVIFMCPESGHITGNRGCLSAYLPVILEDSLAASYLGRISTHQYGDYSLLYGMGDADDWEGLVELGDKNNLNIWETEIFFGGALESDDIHEGLYTALLIHTALTLGNVSAWHYWHYYWPAMENNSTGLVEIVQEDREHALGVYPRYYVMKQWSKNVPVGSIRIGASSDADSLYVTAFKNNGQITIVAFNHTGEDIETTFECDEITGDIRHIRTSGDENYQELDLIHPEGNNFQANIFGHSVNSFLVPVDEEGVNDRIHVIEKYSLLSCYPNPFNSMIRVHFSLTRMGPVNLSVINYSGRTISTIDEGMFSPGQYTVMWNGAGLPTGIYFVKMQEGNSFTISPILLLR